MAEENDKGISRRGFIGLVGKVAALFPVYSVSKTIDSLVGNEAHAQTYEMPSDNELRQWMTQPVEKTLEETGVIYVDDRNYQTEVFQKNIPKSERQPVMVLFYSDSIYSRGNAALVKAINQNFPEIKVGAYRTARGNIVPYDEVQRLKRTYGLRDTPAIMFYKNDNGDINYLAQFSGGIKTLDFLKNTINRYNNDIPVKFLK